MSTSRVLTNEQFERGAVEALKRQGFNALEADYLVRDRYPMSASHAVFELMARGLEEADLFCVEAYMLTQTSLITSNRKWKIDGGDFRVEEISFGRHSLEDLARFVAYFTRVCGYRSSPPRTDPTPRVVTVAAMLAGLRSAEPSERLAAGLALSHSLGVGLALAGETIEDTEHIRAPVLSDLLGKAMAGDHASVDALESLITTDPTMAHRPNRTREESQP
jgi:hypothetical protein